jgi:hypothetical protein
VPACLTQPVLFALTLTFLLTAPGCIRRTLTITSEPSGALVHVNDVEVGRTPTKVPFTFYGVYDVRLDRDGYAPLHTQREAKAPLHDTIGIDLVTELMPWDTHVNLDWHFELQEAEPMDEPRVLNNARQLRALLEREVGER